MATQKRSSGSTAKKTQSKAGATGSRRPSLKAAAQRRKKAPSRAGTAAEKGTTTGRKATSAKAAPASRTGRKAGMLKRALKKGFSELAKVGS